MPDGPVGPFSAADLPICACVCCWSVVIVLPSLAVYNYNYVVLPISHPPYLLSGKLQILTAIAVRICSLLLPCQKHTVDYIKAM